MEKKSIAGKLSVGLTAIVLFFGVVAASAVPAAGDDVTDARQLVAKAQFTLDSFQAAPEMSAFRELARKAKGIFIAPEVLKGAFIVGVSGGSGVFLARNESTGAWNGPAFYTVGEASFGLQAGAQSAEVVILAMTERGVDAMLSSNLKLGADIGIAAGPVGVGASAATANLSADLLSFTRAEGLYGGISLDGAVVATRDGLNDAYHGKVVNTNQILLLGKAHNPQASGLIGKVEEIARG